MKNFYFFFLVLGSLLVGCSDNGGNPAGDGIIKYLELPKVDSVWNPGDIIEIYGIGFNSTSQLWVRPLGTLGESDVESPQVSVGPGSLRFIAPWVYGEHEIVLGHEGVKYVLGTLLFADEPEIPIDGIKLPQIDTLWNPGDIITIEGIGFTEESEIWLCPIDGYSNSSLYVETEISSITAISLSFIVPEGIYDEQIVILIHGGEIYPLGTLLFAEEKIVYYISKIIHYQSDEIAEEEIRYNTQNRIIGITHTAWTEGEEEEAVVRTINYEYTNSQIVSEYINEEGESISTVYDLNEKGLVYKVTYLDTEDEILLEYDEKNQVIKIEDYIINWQDGNIKDIEGDVNYTYNYYTYLWNANLDISSLVGNYEPLLDRYVFSQGLMGRTNNNLMSRYTAENSYQYEYEFDGEKVVKVTQYLLISSEERVEQSRYVIEYR